MQITSPTNPALENAYKLAKSKGYKKDIESFTQLIKTNDSALNNIYDEVVKKGYKKDISAFKNLLGFDNAKSTNTTLKEDKVKEPIITTELKEKYNISEDIKPENPSYENYDNVNGQLISKTESPQERNHRLLKENEISYSELYDRFKNETTLSEEEKQEISKEINDDLKHKGFWNTVKLGAKKWWNGVFSEEEGLQVDTDPLASSKKEAAKKLLDNGLKQEEINDELIFKKAKELEYGKREKSLIESKKRDFLKELSEEDKDALQNYQNFEVKSFSREDKSLMQEQSLLRKNLEKKATEFKELSEQIKQYSENDIPKELAVAFNKKREELIQSSTETKENYLKYAEKRKELGNAIDNLDLFKRDYNGFVNFYKTFDAGMTDLLAGGTGAVSYLNDLHEIGRYGVNLPNDPISEKAKEWSNFLHNDAQKTRNEIMRPVMVDDINSMSDFGSWLTNTAIAQQIPILALTATGVGGITYLGASSTGNKYIEMQNEDANYDTIQNIVVPIAFGGAETVGAIVDASILKGAGRVFNSATSVERRMIAQGMFDRFKEISLDVGGASLKEISEETGTQLFQNILDKYALGKETELAEGVKDAIASSAVFSLMPLLGHGGNFVKGYIKPFNNDIALDKTLSEIESIEQQLNSSENILSETVKAVLQKKLTTKKNSLVSKFSDVAKTVADMDDATYNEIIKVEKEKKAIREDAKAVKTDKTISENVKKLLLKDFEEDFKKAEDKQKELLNPVQKPNSISDEVWQQKKNEAANILIKEKQDTGVKDFNITDSEISKKATELINEKTTQENTIQKTKPEVLPTEVKKEIKTNPLLEKAKKKISELFDFSISNKNDYDWEDIAIVSKEEAKRISEATGLEITEDYKHVIESSTIRHSLRKHGNQDIENERGQIAVTKEDFELVPDIIESPDKVYLSEEKSNQGLDVVVYEKTFEDGTTYYFEEVRKGRKKLAFKTMYKKKPTTTGGRMPSEIESNTLTSETLPAPSKSANTTTNIQKNETQTKRDTSVNQDVRVRVGENDNKGQSNNIQSTVNNETNTESVTINDTNPQIIKLSEKGKEYNANFEEGKLIVTDEKGKEVSKPTYRKVRDKYAENIDFTKGKTSNAEPNIEYHKNVAETSENPSEIAETLLSIRNEEFVENNVAYKDRVISENIGKVSRKQFIQFGDENYITNSIARSYLKNDGKPIDTLAQELSEDYGIEITPQDIVDFILNNPNGANSVFSNVKNEHFKPLEEKFELLTGLPANDKYLKKAVEQKVKNESLEQAYGIFDMLSDEDFLSLEQETRDFENQYYGEKTDKQSNESENATRLGKKNESQSRVREESNDVSRKQNYRTTVNKIINGSARILSPYFRKGRKPIEIERRTLEATVILERNKRTDKSSLGSTRKTKSEQENLLKEYAENEGILFSKSDIINNQGDKQPSGKEADVYFSKDGKTVTKIVNYSVYSETPLDFLNNRISLFNSFFPETSYILKGFVETNDGLSFVLEQSLIPGKLLKQIATLNIDLQGQQKRVNDFMFEQFGMQEDGLDAVGNNNYHIMDLHLKNVIEGTDGNLYIIDAIPELKNKSLGDKFIIEDINEVQKSKLQRGSEALKSLDDTLKKWEDKLDQFGKETLGINMPVAVAQGMIKAMRLAVKTAKTTLDVLEAGRNYVRNTDWYKNLSETDKNNVEKTLTDDRNVFNNMDKIIDDAVEKARKEEKNKSDKRAERLKETSKKLRKKHFEIQKYRNEVINEIRQRLKSDTLSHLTKTDITSILRQMNNAKTFKRVDALIDKADFILSRGEYKKADSTLKKLLREPRKFLKSVNGQPKANRVDNETRKLFNRILNYLSPNSIQLQNLLIKIDEKIANGDISERTLNEKIAIESAILIKDATYLFEASKEVTNRKNNAENAERLRLAAELKERAFNDLQTLLNEGKYKLKEQIKVEAKRLKDITDNFTKATNHKWNDVATNTEKRNAQHKKKNNIFNKILNAPKAVKRFFTKPVTNSFEFLLGYFDQTANHGEGNPYKYFYSGENGIVQADANFKKDKKTIKEEVQNSLKSILGTKLNWIYSAHKHEQKITKEKDSKIYLLKNGKREIHSQTMSIGQALYVHLVSKMPDTKRKLEEQGWDDVAINQLENFLGNDFLRVSDFMTSYLKDKYEKYNTTFNNLLRTDLGFEEGYFPLKYIDADLTMEVDLAGNKFALPSVSNGHLKSKVANKNRIDTTVDAFQVFNGYLNSMERFHHYGRLTKDLNAILSNKVIRNNMKTFDEKAFKDFQKLSKVVIGDTSEIRAHEIENKIYKYNSAIAAGYIGYKGYTALKQFLSMPAYTEKANDVHIGFKGNRVRIPLAGKLFFGSKMIVNLNPVSVWNSYRFLKKNSSHFSDRIDKGTIGDEFIDNLFTQNYSSLYNKALKYIAKKGITPNKIIDSITISTGGKVYYNQQLKNYIKAGLSKSEAHTKAIRDFEISFKLTQQSSDASDLSIIQHSKGVMTSLFVPFKNSQFSYFRRISANSNNIIRRYKNEKEKQLKNGSSDVYARLKAFEKISKEGQTYRDLENVLLYTHVLPLLWQYVASGLPGLLTDWDDDDTDEMIRAGVLGLFDGVFILSDTTKWAYNKLVLDKNWSFETSIIMSEMQTIFNDILKTWKETGEVNENVLLEIGKAYLKTKSINTDTFKNIYDSTIQLILESDFSQENIMQFLNAPKELKKQKVDDNKEKQSVNTVVGFN